MQALAENLQSAFGFNENQISSNGSLTLDETQSRQAAIDHCNALFSNLSAEERVAWSLEHLPNKQVLSSSFGAQAAVSLHLVNIQKPGIPVIFIDTGYLFPETYRFVDELKDRLSLNLQIYRSKTTPAWQEARYGQRWNQGVKGITAYNQENKVEPMERALSKLRVGTWFAGLRRSQSESRSDAPFLSWSRGNRWKVHAIADWTDKDIFNYLNKHDLPYHPLWEKGYISIGDVHTTKSIHDVHDESETRFFGLTRECGLHDIDLEKV
ncbi:MAG: phosphoadenylyl-sulfate reductase [Pseudomonadota bacterium]|nr:phosphoadenylyl-sulfate reductase [Pseudomonadota bacterium]